MTNINSMTAASQALIPGDGNYTTTMSDAPAVPTKVGCNVTTTTATVASPRPGTSDDAFQV